MARFLWFVLLAMVICSGCASTTQQGEATASHSFEPTQVAEAENEAEKALGCAEGGMGVHTPEDVRCYLAQFPDEFVRPINDEIAVLFTNPDSLADWRCYHLPYAQRLYRDARL